MRFWPTSCPPTSSARCTASRDRECQDGLYDYNGKCLAYVALNGSCAAIMGGGPQQCISSAYCDSSTNICKARGTTAATCNADNQCNPSLVCANGTCQTP